MSFDGVNLKNIVLSCLAIFNCKLYFNKYEISGDILKVHYTRVAFYISGLENRIEY